MTGRNIVYVIQRKESIPEILSSVNRLNKSIMKGLTQAEVKKLHNQLELIHKNLEDISKNTPTPV